MLEVRGLDAFHGDVQVLWEVGLKVAAGEMVAVIGPNGAGKSTLLRAVMGLVKTRGSQGPAVLYKGQSLDGLAPEEIVRRGLALVPEGGRVFPEMTCLDNLLVGAHRVAQPRRREELLQQTLAIFPRLAERSAQKAATLSGGERQMLALGRALMGGPQFLLLDEPSLGLHPLMVSHLFEAVARINQAGTAILLVEQKVTFALELCGRAYLLEEGRVALAGSAREMALHDHVRRAYLAV